MSEDKRYKKTRTRIINYFVDYLQSHALQDLSVSNLCSIAHIERHTFYHHYKNIGDLVLDLKTECQEKLNSVIQKIPYQTFHENLLSYFDFIQDNRKEIIAYSKTIPNKQQIPLSSIVQERFFKPLNITYEKELQAFTANAFITACLVSLLNQESHRSREEAIEVVSLYLDQFRLLP